MAGSWRSVSSADNLVAGDPNFYKTTSLPLIGRTEHRARVSIDSAGNQAECGTSLFSDISADGRFVAFSSSTDNLVPGDTQR